MQCIVRSNANSIKIFAFAKLQCRGEKAEKKVFVAPDQKRIKYRDNLDSKKPENLTI